MRPRLAGLIASPAAVDVLLAGAREARDDGALGALGDLLHGGEIAVRGDRETGLDDVHAHIVEQLGDFELLVEGHGGAGTLLAVAQGGVEDDDAVLVGLGLRGHGKILLLECALCRALIRGLPSFTPLSAQARSAQPALRGR